MALSDSLKNRILSGLRTPEAKEELVAAIESGDIADGEVTAAKLATDSVTTIKILNSNVTTAKLADSSVTSAKMDQSLLKTVDVTISSAEMLALFTTPKTLIAAPGSGLTIVVDAIYSTIDFATAAYAVGAAETLDVKYTGGSAVASLTEAYVESSADARAYVNVGSTQYAPADNTALVAQMSATDPTTGDSSVKIRVHYRVVPSLL